MSREDLAKLPMEDVQRLHKAYCTIIECIETIAGGPSNVGSNGEYWSAITRRNACRQIYQQYIEQADEYGN